MKVADFGLSKIKDFFEETSSIVGTPAWSAPEVFFSLSLYTFLSLFFSLSLLFSFFLLFLSSLFYYFVSFIFVIILLFSLSFFFLIEEMEKVLRGEKYDEKVDVYSFAIILWVLFFSFFLFFIFFLWKREY